MQVPIGGSQTSGLRPFWTCCPARWNYPRGQRRITLREGGKATRHLVLGLYGRLEEIPQPYECADSGWFGGLELE